MDMETHKEMEIQKMNHIAENDSAVTLLHEWVCMLNGTQKLL